VGQVATQTEQAAASSTIAEFAEQASGNANSETWFICFAACLLGLLKLRNNMILNKLQHAHN
jgi:hypothetical protein